MGNYEIEVEGVKVKVSVVDNSDVLDLFIAELSSSLENSSATPLLAFDVKAGSYRKLQSPLLILCIRTRCLLVHWRCMNPFPQFLKNFLDNKNVCFVGMGEEDMNFYLEQWPNIECKQFYRVVELRYLAARVLKNPDLECSGLYELANEVGLRYERPENKTFYDRNDDTIFSEEEVEYAEAFEVALGL